MSMRFPRVSAFDLVVGLLGIVAVEWEVWLFHDVPGPRLGRALPLLMLLVLPLLWRRRFPLLVCSVVMGGLAAYGLLSGASPEGLEVIFPLAVVSYSVGAYGDRRRGLVGLAVLAAGYTVYALKDPNITSGRTADLWAGSFFGVAILALWLLGVFRRSRREASALVDRAAGLERQAQAAVTEERARLARELHDIVSHNLSVVVLQASGARAQNGNSPALEKIERSGREALVEMRRLLGVLREDGGDEASLAPQPGIADLGALADRIRAAGLPVELAIEGDWADLPPAVELSVYRIVQESLTNTLKHAGPACARVDVRGTGDAVTVEVVDDGAGMGVDSPREGGSGLVGMRERVALFRGELEAEGRPEGGFAVRARLPLTGVKP